jgi:hypothetical protein
LILGKLYVDHYGTMRIQGNCELSCKLKFKEQSIIDRNPHQVQGFVHSKTGEKLATLFGKWDEAMYYVLGDLSERHKSYDPMSDAVQLWQCADPPQKMTRYGLTAFATTLNELTPGLEGQLPPTDSRLRPDQRHLENGEYDDANAEKLRLEKKQRRVSLFSSTTSLFGRIKPIELQVDGHLDAIVCSLNHIDQYATSCWLLQLF